MKTLKTDEAHAKLTSVVGRLVAETGKAKTYSDAIEALLNKCVMLSAELLTDVDKFTKENPQLGYTAKEELIQEAIRRELTGLLDKKPTSRKRRSISKE